MENKERILIVDDDEAICRVCENCLSMNGYDVQYTTEPTTVLDIVNSETMDLVITDSKMPDINGMEILRELQHVSPDIAVIVMTAYATMEVAISAVNDGAYSFIAKPFHLNEMILAVQNALERRRLVKEIVRLKTLVHLFEVTEKINSTLDVSQLLNTMVDSVLAETNSERAAIFYPDEETEELYVRYAFGFEKEKMDKLRFSRDKGIIGKVFRDKGPVLMNGMPVKDLKTGEPNKPIFGDNVLAIPMLSNEKTLGVLSMFKNGKSGPYSAADRDIASILTSQASSALDNAELILDLEILFLGSMKALAKILDERDPFTHGHSHRVSKNAVRIGQKMGLTEKEMDDLAHAGILHDIGKVGIRDEILLKPGPLTRDEYEVIKTHPGKGYHILKPIVKLSHVVEAVHAHHEWFNGNGYPRGLRGAEIPFAASIISVADAYDSITTDRIYRSKRSHEEAMNILKSCSGTQFHPEVVAVFEKMEINN